MTQPSYLMGENISTAFGSIVSNYYVANPSDATSLVLAQDLKGSSLVVKYHQDYSKVLEKAVKGLIDNVSTGGFDSSYLSNTLSNVSNGVGAANVSISNVSYTVSNVSNSVTAANTSISNVSYTVSNVSNSVTDTKVVVSNVSNSVTATNAVVSNVSNSAVYASTTVSNVSNSSFSNVDTIDTSLNLSMNTLVSKLQLLEHFCLLVNENMNIQDLTSRQLPRRGVGSLPWAINKYTSSQKALTYDLSAISIDCPTIASTNLDSPNLVPGTYIPTNYADITITKPVETNGSVFRAIGQSAVGTNWDFYAPVAWTPGGNGYLTTPYPQGNLVPLALDYTFSRLYFIENAAFTAKVGATFQPSNLLNVMQFIAYDVKQAPNQSFSVSSYFMRLTRVSGLGNNGSGITVVPTRISLRKPTLTNLPYDTVVVDTLTYVDPYTSYNWAANTGVSVTIEYLYTTLLEGNPQTFQTENLFAATNELIPSNGSIISFSSANAEGFDKNSTKYISFNTSHSDADFQKIIRILQNVPDLTNVTVTFTTSQSQTYVYELTNDVPNKNTVPPSNRFYTVCSSTSLNAFGNALTDGVTYKVKVEVTAP